MAKFKDFWAIRVGNPSNAYFLDNKIFDRRKDAAKYLKEQGEKRPYWHIVKVREVQK